METVQPSRAVQLVDGSEPAAPSTLESFRQHVEPLIARVDAADWSGAPFEQMLTIRRYAQIWREPSSQRDLSVLLETLLPALAPGQRCLCVGLGLLPLAYVLAARSVWVDLCDADARQVRLFRHLRLDSLWGDWVDYATEDLGRMTYPRATFDAVAWAPGTVAAEGAASVQAELRRVLKPGGRLAAAPERQGRSIAARPSRSGALGAILRLGLWKTDLRGSW